MADKERAAYSPILVVLLLTLSIVGNNEDGFKIFYVIFGTVAD